MSYDPIYPTFSPPALVTPSAPPPDAVENAREAEKSGQSFTITCIALGALAILAGVSIGSIFVFGTGIVLGLVGLTSSVPRSTIHISPRHPGSVILPYTPRPPHFVTYVTPPQSRSRPIFVTQAPPRSAPSHIPERIIVGGRRSIFNVSDDRVQVGH